MSLEKAHGVLGQRVEILFEDDQGNKEFYCGTIAKARMELDKDESLTVEHFVEFDDGDTYWFVLEDEEKEGRLRWRKRAAAAAAVVSPPRSKKQKISDKEKVIVASSDKEQEEEEVTVPDPLPKSIKEVIQFMDKLEPNKKYFERQKDSRGECSGTRGKIRKFAKKNPDHPAVKHWVKTNNWQPPDEESLFALMDLIKTKISKK